MPRWLPRWLDGRRRVSALNVLGGLTALLLGVVFLIPTPAGTLRIEILAPNVEVRIKGTSVLLKGADVHGGVAEWVHDPWSADEYGRRVEDQTVDPRGPAMAHVSKDYGTYRVIRGGRAAARHGWPPVAVPLLRPFAFRWGDDGAWSDHTVQPGQGK
jgi:hypothetical protein